MGDVMNHGQKVLALSNELKEMREEIILSKIRTFSITLDILEGNYNELIYYLETHNTPKTYFELNNKGREYFDAFRTEVMRVLHNYIASAFSLIDHTRNHYNDLYSDNNLFPDYQLEIDKQFKLNHVARFIKDLRKHIQHYEIPDFSSRIHYSADAPDFVVTFLLPLKGLQSFSGYSSVSKEFIAMQEDDIDLLELVKTYHLQVTSFYKWFKERQDIIHQKDIEKVNAHIDKIRKLEIEELLRKSFNSKPSAGDFEQNLFRFFPDEDIVQIQKADNTQNKTQAVIELIGRFIELNDQNSQLIFDIYNTSLI